jgi:gliding motility-associated-like protein
MKKFVILVFIFTGFIVSAQDHHCAMESHMEEMMKDPHFAREWELQQQQFKQSVKQNLGANFRQQIMDEIVIPVAVHFPSGLESDRACLEALAQNQVDILNGDFTATNPDSNLWNTAAQFYPGVIHGVANVQFCIATSNHPTATDDDLVEGGPAVTIGYDFGGGNDADNAWSGYMNFLVKDIGGSVLGYSPLGGSINAGQSVVINTYAFGSGTGCSASGIVPGGGSNLGRTTTHELGHFFNLQHTFSGSCASDDGIADTPNIVNPNYGCPAPGSIAGCESGEFALTMSYMDYGNDPCLYMFSQGQTDVMDTYVGILQSQFKPNTIPVCVQIPEYIITNGSVTSCNGLFYDSGGAGDATDPGQYTNNEVYTYTICPEGPGQSTQLVFSEFQTQNNTDVMSIYNASDASDPATLIGEFSGTNSPGTVAATLTNTSGCLTIVFTSNEFNTDLGWEAFISCINPPAECQTIVAQLDSASPAPNDEGIILVCQGESITLNGSGQFSEAGGGTGAAYQWDIGDGTTISGQSATFSFDAPGVYIANLNIWDTNTSVFAEGCKNDNKINQVIRVSTTPDISASDDTATSICYGDSSTITAVVTPTPYINECTPPESNVTFLPDGNGDVYNTCIVVDCFESDQTLEDISQIIDICLNIEHSYLGDLDIIIVSPNGQQAYLHQYPGGGNTYLGAPIDDGSTTPGTGADYCFSANATSLLVNGPTITAGNPANPSIAPGTYLPQQSFNQLVGSPLNGNWCITVVDNLTIDNGYIFSWGINFDSSIVPPNQSFTPDIVSSVWSDDPTITDVNGDTISISPDGDGQYCYTYTVLDNFGCEYFEEICIEVLPELIYDPPNDLFICDPGSAPYVFDLGLNQDVVLAPNPNPSDFVLTFHNLAEDAENDVNAIGNLNSYEGNDQETVYIRFEYLDSNCYEIESFELNLLAAPQIFPVSDMELCDDISNDGIGSFNLEDQTIDILGTQSSTGYLVTYYDSLSDAEAGTNNLNSPYETNTTPLPVYVRVEVAGGTGCSIVSTDPLFDLILTNKAVATAPSDLIACDPTAFATFDLETQTAVILGSQDPATFTVTYHTSPEDAATGANALSSPLNASSQTIYVRVEESGLPNCYDTTQFDITVDLPPTIVSGGDLTDCDSGQTLTATATVNSGESIVWYDAATGGTVVSDPSLTGAGTVTYYAEATNDTSGCVSVSRTPVSLTIQEAPTAPISNGDLTECDSGQTLTATATVNTDQTLTWYDAATGGTVVPDPSLTGAGTVTYYAETTDAATGCTSLTRTVVILTINSSPAAAIANNLTECDSGQTLTAAATVNSGESIVWYDAASGGIVVPDPSLTGVGTVTYYAEASNDSTGCISSTLTPVTLTIEATPPPPISNGDLGECDSGQTLTATATVNTDQTLTWYDAASGGTVVPDPSLTGAGTVTYYAEATDATTGCTSTTRTAVTLTIGVAPSPPVGTSITACDSGQTLTATATVNSGETLIWYDAASGGTVVSDPSLTGVGTVTYYAEASDDVTACISTTRTAVTLIIEPLPDAPISNGDLTDCDSGQTLTATATVNTDQTLTWYDAASGGTVVSDPSLIGAGTVTYYAEATDATTGCTSAIRTAVSLTLRPLPFLDLESEYVICEDTSGGGLDSVEIDSGFSAPDYSFIWVDGSGFVIDTASAITIDQSGTYSLEVTDNLSGCSSELQIFTVSESGAPEVTAAVTTEAFADTHVIVATASGTGIYEFSLDQGPWQDSGTFIGVSPGQHTVSVRDVNGCGVTTYELIVIDYPAYFTPNGDGYNDSWNVGALSGQLASKIYIFDRYGKLLKQISPAGEGWDGTYNGQKMPTTDYWFLMEYNDFNTGEPRQLRSHFALKR